MNVMDVVKRLVCNGKQYAPPPVIAVEIMDENPDYPDAIKMEHYAVDAYGAPGDFTHEARVMSVRTVAAYFGITDDEALEQFEIYITPIPGLEYHGWIFARPKKDK